MTVRLADISACFEGEIPSIIVTSTPEGETNLAHLSHVLLVDADHVATSNQFFTKTAANLADNPVATLLCVHPTTMLSYKLLVRHERSEQEGSLFDRVRASIEMIASATGMAEVFALRGVDVFRVLDTSLVPSRGTATAS